MSMEHRRYNRPNISIAKQPTNSEAGIQLNERQLQLLRQKRNRPAKAVSPTPQDSILSIDSIPTSDVGPASNKRTHAAADAKSRSRKMAETDGSWSANGSDHLYARTAPTAASTSWADSASSASASGASSATIDENQENTTAGFYGQRLDKKDKKKLYDDTGATWDSKSGVSTASTDSIDVKGHRTSAAYADRQTSKDRAPLGLDLSNQNEPSTTQRLQKKSERQSLPANRVASQSLRRKNSKSIASSAYSIKSAPPDGTEDPQKAFLRKVMQSYAKNQTKSNKAPSVKKKSSFSILKNKSAEDTGSTTSGGSGSLHTKTKKLWSRKASNLFSAAKSVESSGSSGAGDKAILKKVLARAARKTTNPRTKDKLPASMRMKKLLTPRGTASSPKGFERQEDQQSASTVTKNSEVSQSSEEMPAASVKTTNSTESRNASISGKRSSSLHTSSVDSVGTKARKDTRPTRETAPRTSQQGHIQKQGSSQSESSKASKSESQKLEQHRPQKLDRNVSTRMHTKDPAGYSKFLDALQMEASTTHPELWTSFHNLFQEDGEAQITPSLSSKSDSSKPLQKGLDPKTKNAIASMSHHLRRQASEEHWGTVSQIAQPKKEKSQFGQHILNKPATNDRSSSSSSIQDDLAPSVSMDSIDDADQENEFEVTLAQHARKSMGPQDVKPLPEKAEEPRHETLQQSYSQSTSGVTESTGNTSARNEIRSQMEVLNQSKSTSTINLAKPTEEKAPTATEEPISVVHSEPVESQGSFGDCSRQSSELSVAPSDDTNFITVAKGTHKSSKLNDASTFSKLKVAAGPQKIPNNAISKKRTLPSTNPASSEVSIPWSGIKLRSVRDPEKCGASDVSVPSAWAKVKLRHVDLEDDANTPATGTNSAPATLERRDAKDDDKANDVRLPSDMTTKSAPQQSQVLHTKSTQSISSNNGSQPSVPFQSFETNIAEIKLKPVPVSETNTGDSINEHSHTSPRPPPAALPPPPPPAAAPTTATAATSTPLPSVVADKGKADVKSTINAFMTKKVAAQDVDINSVISVKSEKTVIDVTNMVDATDRTNVSQSLSVPHTSPSEISVPLKRVRNENGVFQESVRVNQNELVKFQSLDEQCEEIIWQVKPENIRSMTFDMGAMKVRLLMADDRDVKDLLFDSKDDYLAFSRVLHDLSSSAVAPPQDDPSMESTVVEQLNEEEKEVLEAYRKRRLTQPSSEAMQETIAENLPVMEYLGTVNTPSSPSMSAISGVTGVSVIESKLIDTYQKMLKMKIPVEAVRHRMEKEQASARVMEIVLNENPSTEAATSSTQASDELGLSTSQEAIAKTFRKMLQLRIPPEAVEHKMRKEGVDQKIIAAVLGHEIAPPTTEKAMSAQDQKIVDSYKKMSKMGIPTEAIEHKMKKDGIDAHLMEAVLGKSLAPPKKESDTLSDEEESIACSYRQMLTLRIPKEVVRQRMQTEGISDIIVAAVLGDKLGDGPKKVAPKKKNKSHKKGFHWNALTSDEQLANSIWGKVKTTNFADDCSDVSAATDISKHVEKFQKPREVAKAAKKLTSNTTGADTEMAKLIDLNRANNIAISLQAYKEFSREELAQIIQFVDPNKRLVDERVQFMKDLLPAQAEAKIVEGYTGPDSRLVPAEIWFRQIAHVKRLEEKVQVLNTIGTFKNEAKEIGRSFKLLINVCNQVMDSEKLPDLLNMVRQIGNIMNEDRGVEAAGFKLDFLPRLAQTKGSDKKTSALDLVVMIFVERNQREALMLSDDFPDCHAASKIQLSDLVGDVRSLGGALRKCAKESNEMEKEAASTTSRNLDARSEPAFAAVFATKRSGNKTDVGAGKDDKNVLEQRAKFMAKLKATKETVSSTSEVSAVGDLLKAVQVSNEDNAIPAISPRVSLRASMKAKLNPELETRVEYTTDNGVKRIKSFLREGEKAFAKLESERDNAIQACKDLAEFFCEPGGEKTASSLLRILSEFADNLNSAVKKFNDQEAIQLRKEAVLKKKKTAKVSRSLKSSTTPTPSKPPKPEEINDKNKSLVMMVYEMCKVAGEKAKEDFSKGLTYEETEDERLKGIYEAEQARLNGGGSKKNVGAVGRNKQRDDELGLPEPSQTMQQRASPRLAEDASTTSSNISSELASALLSRASKASIDESESSSNSTVASGSQENDATTKPAAKAFDRRDQALARWARSDDADEVSSLATTDVPLPEAVLSEKRKAFLSRWVNSNNEVNDEETEINDSESVAPLQMTNSEILSADSEDMEETRLADKRRKSYLDRWMRKSDDDEEEDSDVASINGIPESEVGTATVEAKRRLTLIERWTRKSEPDDESVDEGPLFVSTVTSGDDEDQPDSEASI